MDDYFPSQTKAEELCQTFVELTGTDSALALMFLQERNWDVQTSVNDYLELTAKKKSPSASEAAAPTPLNRLRLMSWNIDGLHKNNLAARTKAVVQTILRDQPHIVYLQEVVPESEQILDSECVGYQIISSREGMYEPNYYTCMLLRVENIRMHSRKTVEFSNSQMGRSLHYVQVYFKSLHLLCINTHLESTKEGKDERIEQLNLAFSRLKTEVPSAFAVFGGDLNVRDHEVPELPKEISDLWNLTGSRKEAAYTWDTSRNDNLRVSYRARLRFDRLYFRQPLDSGYCGPSLRPVYFELVGLQRVKSCGRFPSDHWGLLVHFDIV